jgi:type IV pilus assembly protein PilW
MQAGFGIIEIMIALALGVIIMLGVTEIASNNSSTRYELDRSGRQMENAAFALREIENDLTSAGFWGEKGAEGPGTFPPVCPDDIAGLQQSMGYPVQGWQEGKALGSNAFDCDNLGAIVPTAGTDYLAIRRASSCAVGETGCAAADGNFHLQVHSCASDATRAGSFDISADTGILNFLQRDCAAEAPIYRFLNRIYYIENDRLMRAELVGTGYTETVLVEGVEMMRLEYGMDRDADGQVDAADGITFDPTDDPLNPGTEKPVDWSNVVMVRISLVVRNTKSSGGFVDSKTYTVAGENYSVPAGFEDHRRQVYSRTVGLRNVAGRREVAP